MQLQAKVSTDPTFSNLGPASLISAVNTNKTISITATDFESIPNFGDGATILVTAIITDLAGNSTTGTQSSSTTFVDQTAPLLSGPIRVYTNAGQLSGANHEVIQFLFNEDITLVHNDIPKNSTTFGGPGFSVDDDQIGDARYYNDGAVNAVDNSLTNTRLVYLESTGNGTGPFPAWSVGSNTQVQYVPGGLSGTSDYIVDLAGNELAAFTQTVSDGDLSPPTLSPDVMTLYPRAGSPEKIIFTLSEQLGLNDGDAVTGFSTNPVASFSATYDGNNGLGPFTITMLSNTDGSWTSGTTVNYTNGTGNVKDIANNELGTIVNHVLVVETDPPVITNVSIPDVTMNVGDVVTATITVNNDDGDVPVLTSGTIGGYPLGSFSGTGPTTYTATFTITEGGNSYAAGSDIPVANLVLTDLQGNSSSVYNTPIAQANDLIDATSPQVTSIAIASPTNPWSTSNGTAATSVDFIVTFSENVTGVDLTDFAATVSGSLSGPVVSNVAGTGTTYTVTVNAYANTGNLRLDFIDDGSVFDTPGGNPVVGPGAIPDGSFKTGESYYIVLPEPTDHVTGFTATPINTNTVNLSWVNPTSPVQPATHYLLLVDGQDINDLPGVPATVADGVLVADDTDFNDGNGAAVIAATATSYSFTTLISGNTYNFQIFPLTKSVDYPDDNTDYKGRTGSVDDGGVPAASATTPTAQLGTITAGSTTEPAAISSLATSYGTDIVLDFMITDDGPSPSADDAKLKFTQLVITAGAGNTVTNWADVIAEAELKDITDNNTEISTNITANTITFAGLATDAGDFGRIEDNATKEYQLRIRLKASMGGTAPQTVDGQRFEFEIRESGFTYKDASSSKISTSEFENSDPTSGGTNNTVTVVATQLDFITNPDPTAVVLTNLTTPPVLNARDANGNLDLDFGDLGETVTINNTDGIQMFNLEAGNKITAVNGVITFPANFQYGDSGNGTLLVTDSNNLLTPPASPTTVTVSYDSNNTITAGALAEPATISSILTTAPGQPVYDFVVTDDAAGAGDGSPTRITQLVITQGTGNDIANWTEAIAGATLTDGINTVSGVVNATNLTFGGLPTTSGSIGYIGDNAAKTYTLNIWLNSTMGGTLATTIDNLNFVFEVTDNTTNITLDALSSKFTGTENNNSGSTNNAVEVISTLLAFTTQPPATVLVNANLTVTPVIEAVDSNNNRDLDYSSPLTLTNAKSLGMVNVPTAVSAGSVAFASNFSYTDIGDGSAGNGTLTATVTTPAANGSVPAATLSTDVLVRVGAATLITGAGTTSEPATIASTTDASPGTFVFDFKVTDDAGGEDDGNATLLTDIIITQGTNFNDPALADWSKVIAGAILYDDETTPNSATGIIGSNTISFSSLPFAPGQMGYVADNASKTYQLTIWLYDSLDFRISGFTLPLASYAEPTVLVDNKKLEFTVAEINIVTNPSGSDFQTGEMLSSGDANSIDVTTTSIDFTLEPPAFASINTPYSVRAEARDVNDNRDLDFNANLSGFTNQGTLAMLNAPTTADSFTAGLFDLNPNFQYDESGLSPAGQLTLTANSFSAVSQPIEVIASFDSYVTADNSFLQNNINAIQFDATDILNDGLNDVVIARFILHDGKSPLSGGSADQDGAITKVTDLDINITGFANLRKIALYAEDIDSNGYGLGTFSEVDEQVAAATVNFEDLSTGLFYAADDTTRTFIIVASFLDSYTDNDVIQINITNIEGRLGGSQFNLAEPLPGTDPAKNIVEVTATQIDFNTPPLASQQGVNIPLLPNQPQVFAHDAKGNLDLDFNAPVTVTSGVALANIPANFGNVTPGVLDFPGFTYASAGNGTLTVSAAGLNTTSNSIDVIHTTISTLDIGGISNATNNGIEASSLIVAGGSNKAILGFRLAAIQQTANEPTLIDLTVRFGNPIAGSLNNIRLLSSVDSAFVFPESNVNNTTVVGTDYVTFQGISVPLTSTPLYYFVVADIDPTANFSTPQITPQLVATGVPANDVVLSTGSVSANVVGRTYGFNDVNPPVVNVLTPLNNDQNFPQNNLISIQFNEVVIPLDSIITLYKLVDDSFVATLKLDPLLTSADSTTFYFNPLTPFAGDTLAGDTYYYILVAAGDLTSKSGFVDKSGNPYAGISSASEWNFKTSDNVAPFFTADLPTPTLPADAVNIVDVGFDLRVALDEPGKVFYIVVDPTVDTGTPTVDEIRNGTFGTVLASGTADILRGYEYHYISIFDSNNFPTGGSGDFRVWMTAEDNALPTPNKMVDGDITHPGKAFVDNQFAPGTGSGIIVQGTPGNVPVDICLGDPQLVFSPINLVEGANGDFNVGVGQTINFVLPSGFIFDTSAITVSAQGGDIGNVSASFINNTILTVTYDISGTGNRDKLSISNMRVQAVSGVGTAGDIIRLGGTGATSSIPDGTVIASLGTYQINAVGFTTDPNTASISDINEKIPLIPDLGPLDKGTAVFSGPGVFGDTLYVAAAGLGTHTITLQYTSEQGCTAESSQIRTIFDNDRAIAGLAPSYCTQDIPATIAANGRPLYTLLDLQVEVAPQQPPGVDTLNTFGINVDSSLVKVGIDYVFNPSLYHTKANYDKFTNLTAGINDGGLIGELLFTGIYNNNLDNTIFDTLQQRVKVFFSPTGEITIGSFGPIGDNTFDSLNIAPTTVAPAELEFCVDAGPVPLKGSSANGYFTLSMVIPDPNNPGLQIVINDSLSFPGLTDFRDGNAELDPQVLVDSSDFNYGELTINYITNNPDGGCDSRVAQTIRIHPRPVAAFTLPAITCEGTPISFGDATFYTPADSVFIANGQSINNTTFPAIDSWLWSFDDPNADSNNPNFATGADTVHTYTNLGLYDVNLKVVSEFNCAADTTVTLVVGGIPQAGFIFSGASLSDDILFQSTSTVESSSVNLSHTIDSVLWDVDGDTVYDLVNDDNDSIQDNTNILTYNYPNAGVYDVNFRAVSSTGCSSTLTRKVVILANEIAGVSGDSIYNETFENTNGNWVTLPEYDQNNQFGNTSTWAWGNPAGKAIAPGSEQGNNVWITGLTAPYDSAEQSYVYSPVFDLRLLDRPMIKIDIFAHLEEQDGVILEYSTDSLNVTDPAKTWQSLGALDEGINWFNAVGLAGSPGNDVTGLGWAHDSTGWIQAKHDLAAIYQGAANQGEVDKLKSRVVFRFGLGAIPARKDKAGFAFDNIFLGNRTRTVLLENFTSMAGSAVNKTQNDAINTLANNAATSSSDTELIVITYRTGFDGEDPLNLANQAVPAARAIYYGIAANPRVAIDGATSPDGTNNSDLLFTEWGQTYYSKRSLQIAPFEINVSPDNQGDGKLHIKATITANTNELTNPLTVQVAVVEKLITASELGVSPASGEVEFYTTVRDLLPDAGGTRVASLLQGEDTTVSVSWQPTNIVSPLDNLDPSTIEVVVFVQDEITKEVHQATRIDVDYDLVLGIKDELEENGIALYPNPADQYLNIKLAARLMQDKKAFIYDNTGRRVEELSLATGTRLIELNTNAYQPGIYLFVMQGNNGSLIQRFIVSH